MPRVKQFNEEEVLHKAMELFWRKGFHATSMQDLIDTLGINRASLYDTFGGKQQLFDRAFTNYKEISRKRMIAILESESTVKDGFRKLFQLAIDEAVSDSDKKGCFVVNTTTAIDGSDDPYLPILQENKVFIEDTFYQLLVNAEKNGELKKGRDLKSMAALLFTYYNGLQISAKVDTDKNKLLGSVAQLLQLLD